MLSAFKEHIKKWNWIDENTPLAIACSGGVDSVVLVYLCKALRLNFSIVHCNFQLRGSDSDADEEFVRQLANSLSMPFFVKTFETLSVQKKQGGSIQMVARNLRYEWFENLVQDEGFEAILMAHHSDDVLETFLINLSRGTGLSGLIGIPETNKNVYRPLLPFSRQQLVEYAEERKIQWREDSSNIETKYLRNQIRHEIVPNLKGLHPNFLQNFEKTVSHLSASGELLKRYKNVLQDQLFEVQGETIQIDLQKLTSNKVDSNLLYLLFSEFGFTQWSDMLNLIESESGKEVRSQTHRLLKHRDTFFLTTINESPNLGPFFVQEMETQINFPIKLSLKDVDSIDDKSKNSLFVDKQKLSYPLTLRKWQEGDWFFPFGMKGKKKVSKFLKDEKVDLFSKESVWLLLSGEEVVWVVGMRADNRFKIDRKTKKILKVKIG